MPAPQAIVYVAVSLVSSFGPLNNSRNRNTRVISEYDPGWGVGWGLEVTNFLSALLKKDQKKAALTAAISTTGVWVY